MANKVYKGVRLSRGVVDQVNLKELELKEQGYSRTTFTMALEALVREYAILKSEKLKKTKGRIVPALLS